MLEFLLTIYISLISVIFAGLLNSILCRSKTLNKLNIPIDNGKNWVDGKRLFGDHKTVKGFLGYILLNAVFMVIWGLICSQSVFLNDHNLFYKNYDNTLLYNIFMGALLGLAWAAFELPNSFIKRRLDIHPGKISNKNTLLRVFFVFLDQADSIFGCMLIVALITRISIANFFVYIIIGSFTHIIFNILLFLIHIRKNPF